MGDNITPPQQAFNWIGDLYSSTEEIKAAGQTIVGLLHEDIGHLGIFVSGAVAKKEHAQIVELLKQIQQLPPGLYGMDIKERAGRRGANAYDVTIVERTLEDLRKMQKYDRVDEKPFEAVAALSELTERAYELLARPLVRELSPEWLARLRRDLHPLRVQRWAISDKNPLLWWLPYAASAVTANRKPRRPDSALSGAGKAAAESVSAALDLCRDLRDATAEAAFFHVYGNMLSLNVADQQKVIRRATRFDPRTVPAVKQVLDTLDQGTPAEAYVRIGLLMSKAGGGKRKLAQMERVRELVAPALLLDRITEDEFRTLMHEETIIVEFEPERAKRALPKLLRSAADRRHAHELLDVMQSHFRLDPKQRALVAELKALLPAAARAAARQVAAATSRKAPSRQTARRSAPQPGA
jgi:hypothetical protein